MRGLELAPEKTFATNLFFAESRAAADLNIDELWAPCWAVHREMLGEIRPACIVSLGNGDERSVFSRLRLAASEQGRWHGKLD